LRPPAGLGLDGPEHGATLLGTPGDGAAFTVGNTRTGRINQNGLYKHLLEYRSGITAHGMRSTFAVWCQERTNYAEQLREHALAHIVGDASARAYARSDMVEKRRALMEMWAKYCTATPAAAAVGDNVTTIGGRQR